MGWWENKSAKIWSGSSVEGFKDSLCLVEHGRFNHPPQDILCYNNMGNLPQTRKTKKLSVARHPGSVQTFPSLFQRLFPFLDLFITILITV